MPIVNITLEDILRARDARADAQRRLLRTYRLPLVSFTMNIAGPVKSSPLIALAFDTGLEALYDALVSRWQQRSSAPLPAVRPCWCMIGRQRS